MLYEELLENARVIEVGVEKLYRKYADLLKDDQEIADLFGKMADEKARHVKTIIKLKPDRDIQEPAASPLPILRNQRDLIDLLGSYHEIDESEVDVREALRSAFRLENSLTERNLKRIGSLFLGNTRSIFQRLSEESMQQTRRVRTLARERQIRFSNNKVEKS